MSVATNEILDSIRLYKPCLRELPNGRYVVYLLNSPSTNRWEADTAIEACIYAADAVLYKKLKW